MGARGNSGVILSQIFRGFAMGLEGHESVDAVAFPAWITVDGIFIDFIHGFAIIE